MVYITSDKAIQDIQQEFSQEFPFLKIEFFRKGVKRKQYIPKESYLQVKPLPGKIDGLYNRSISLAPGIRVKELQERCDEVFGVYIGVYRKFRNLWLETTITVNFTLQQQNDHMSEVQMHSVQ